MQRCSTNLSIELKGYVEDGFTSSLWPPDSRDETTAKNLAGELQE